MTAPDEVNFDLIAVCFALPKSIKTLQNAFYKSFSSSVDWSGNHGRQQKRCVSLFGTPHRLFQAEILAVIIKFKKDASADDKQKIIKDLTDSGETIFSPMKLSLMT